MKTLLYQTLVGLLFLGICHFPSQAQETYRPADLQQLLQTQRNHDLTTTDLQELRITGQYTDAHNDVTHVYAQQQHNGLDIVGATLSFHFDAAGEPLHSTQQFWSDKSRRINRDVPLVTATGALQRVLNELDITGEVSPPIATERTTGQRTVFAAEDLAERDMTAELVYFPSPTGALRLSWQVEIYVRGGQHYYVFQVDAERATILDRRDLVIACTFDHGEQTHRHHHGTCAHETQPAVTFEASVEAFNSDQNSYRVYDAPVAAPTFGERTLKTTTGDGDASPLGWHNDGQVQYDITRGNNVFAYHDAGPDTEPQPATGTATPQGGLSFDFPANLHQAPETYRDAAITNLFYWNNHIHDVFHHYGFTEAAGNFQQNNFGNGGLGQDAVQAEAQDGGGMNNATFLALQDGQPARMQMFLWANLPILDGDFDNGVIVHEYAHGISTRLTGGPEQTCLGGAEQGGEGWSDYFALMLTMNPTSVPENFATGQGMATYVMGQDPDGAGIRPAKYSTDFSVNPYTFGDLTNDEIIAPHGVGFIWGTMLWEMTAALVDEYGYDPDLTSGNGGNNIALQLVVDALKLQPCSPTFVEMRDAILAADEINHGGAHRCLIWESFAKRGLGYSAESGTNDLGDEIAAFDLPPATCAPAASVETKVLSRVSDESELDIEIRVRNHTAEIVKDVLVVDVIPAGTELLSISHPAETDGQTVKFHPLTLAADTTIHLTITVLVNAGTTTEIVRFDNLETDADQWTASSGEGAFEWSDSLAFSGDYAFSATGSAEGGSVYLTQNEPVTVTEGMELRFAHHYRTKANFDGGRVEVSTDGGGAWSDLGEMFLQNGYNQSIAADDNPIFVGYCFGGDSEIFLHSRADLSAFAGQQVLIRFHLNTTAETDTDGWIIDDVEFLKHPTFVHNTVHFVWANGGQEQEFRQQILILNETKTEERALHAGTENIALRMGIHPNPATDRVNLNFESLWEGPVTISVANSQGQVQWQRQEARAAGYHRVELSVHDWTPGLYTVYVQRESEVSVQRLVVN